YGHIFERAVPGLAERAAAEHLAPLDYMRRYGAYEIRRNIGPLHAEPVPATELADVTRDALGRVFSRAPCPPLDNLVPTPTPDGDDDGRRRVGIEVDGG